MRWQGVKECLSEGKKVQQGNEALSGMTVAEKKEDQVTAGIFKSKEKESKRKAPELYKHKVMVRD